VILFQFSGRFEKRLKLKNWAELDSEGVNPALVWRIDDLEVGDSTNNIVCVNERSLFSFVLVDVTPFTEAEILQQVINRLASILGAHHFTPEVVKQTKNGTLYKTKMKSRSFVGCVNKLKKDYKQSLERGDHPMVAENVARDGFFSKYLVGSGMPGIAFMLMAQEDRGTWDV